MNIFSATLNNNLSHPSQRRNGSLNDSVAHEAKGFFCRLANGPKSLPSVQRALQQNLPTVLTHLDGKPIKPGSNLKQQLEASIKKGSSFLESAFLKDVNAPKVNLAAANLSRVELEKANLQGANLSKTDLYDIRGCKLDLRQANLSRANLTWANLYKAKLQEVNLYGADLMDADLYQANLYKANLNKAKFYFALLFRTNLFKSNLERSNLCNTSLYFANLKETNLNKACFKRAHIDNCNFKGSYLENINFEGANLTRNDFENATLKNVNLGSVNTEESDDIFLTLYKENSKSFKHSYLFSKGGNNFKNTTIEDVDVTMAQLPYSNLTDVNLVKTKEAQGFKGTLGNFEHSVVSSKTSIPTSLYKDHFFD